MVLIQSPNLRQLKLAFILKDTQSRKTVVHRIHKQMDPSMQLRFRHTIKGALKSMLQKLRIKEHMHLGSRGCPKLDDVLAPFVGPLVDLQPEEGPLLDEIMVFTLFLEDKFSGEKRFPVEELQVEMKTLVEDPNGFQLLQHPGLDDPKALESYFSHWVRCTLKSLQGLLSTIPISFKFLNPITNKEKHSSSSMKARYRLVMEVQSNELQQDSKCIESPQELKQCLKARHFIGNLLVQLKFSYLEDFKKIWDNALQTSQNIISRGRRSRFFSEEVSHPMEFSSRDRIGTTVRESLVNISRNSDVSNNSLRRNSKPFKVQNDLVDDNFLSSLILSSKDSNESLKPRRSSGAQFFLRKSSNSTIRGLSIGDGDSTDVQYQFIEEEVKKDLEGEEGNSRGVPSRRRGGGEILDREETSIHNSMRKNSFGLARIGTRLLEAGNILDSDLCMDDDDLIMELMNMNDQLIQDIIIKSRRGSSSMSSLSTKNKNARVKSEQVISESNLEEEGADLINGGQPSKIVAEIVFRRKSNSPGVESGTNLTDNKGILEWAQSIEERFIER